MTPSRARIEKPFLAFCLTNSQHRQATENFHSFEGKYVSKTHTYLQYGTLIGMGHGDYPNRFVEALKEKGNSYQVATLKEFHDSEHHFLLIDEPTIDDYDWIIDNIKLNNVIILN